MKKQLEESILFHQSLNEYKYKRNLILYLWLSKQKTNSCILKYLKNLPYELVRGELGKFVLLGNQPKYYKVIDNTIFNKKYLEHKGYGGNNHYINEWWSKRVKRRFIGKCTSKKKIKYDLPKHILNYLDSNGDKKIFY